MLSSCFFFFNDTATTEIYTLSLHDALPISLGQGPAVVGVALEAGVRGRVLALVEDRLDAAGVQLGVEVGRSEEHTSELQSRQYLVCRLLLEKKKTSKLTQIKVYTVECRRDI